MGFLGVKSFTSQGDVPVNFRLLRIICAMREEVVLVLLDGEGAPLRQSCEQRYVAESVGAERLFLRVDDASPRAGIRASSDDSQNTPEGAAGLVQPS
jgi:hypothetical protein